MSESDRVGDPGEPSGTGSRTVHEVVTLTDPAGRSTRQFRYVAVDRDDLIVDLRVRGRSLREIAREVGCAFRHSPQGRADAHARRQGDRAAVT